MKIQWSHSSIELFYQCPWRYYLVKVTKQVKEAMYAHRATGVDLHKAIEKAGKNEAPLPEEHKRFQPLVDRIQRAPGVKYFEYQVALTEGYQPVSWFDKDVWVRCIYDYANLRPDGVSAVILDWKTGKRKSDPDQLRLFAATAFALWPKLERVTTGYIWLKDEQLDRDEYTRDELPNLWLGFEEKVAKLRAAHEHNRWPKNPSGLCRQWCPVGRKLCEHCGQG